MPSSIDSRTRFGLKKILVPTDFSEASKQALPPAISLARQFDATISVVYVVNATLPAELSHIGIVLDDMRLRSQADGALTRFRERELPADVRVETLAAIGGPAHQICELARKHEADLIVTATHGHTGLKHFLLGSTAERVVREAPCPVLSIRAPILLIRFPETNAVSPMRIIVPVDFSDGSLSGVRYALAFAERFHSSIKLLHVIEPFASRQFDDERRSRTDRGAKTTAALQIAKLRDVCGPSAVTEVRNGHAFEEIVQASRDWNSDLVILSTHGRTGLKRLLLGSTAERVVQHAACPVLVVRERERDFLFSTPSDGSLGELRRDEDLR